MKYRVVHCGAQDLERIINDFTSDGLILDRLIVARHWQDETQYTAVFINPEPRSGEK